MRTELKPLGVNVTLVKFGAVKSNISANKNAKWGRFSDHVKNSLWSDWLPKFDGSAPVDGITPWDTDYFAEHVVNKGGYWLGLCL
jgi:hypothetical protein